MTLGAKEETPLVPRDAVFLEEYLAGKLLFATCTTAAIVALQDFGCRRADFSSPVRCGWIFRASYGRRRPI